MRAALPSSLVGLVSFSFVALAFGVAVYLAALPSLVSSSPVVSQAVEAATDQQDDTSADKASPDGPPTSGEGKSDRNPATDAQTSDGSDELQGQASGNPSAASDSSAADDDATEPDTSGATLLSAGLNPGNLRQDSQNEGTAPSDGRLAASGDGGNNADPASGDQTGNASNDVPEKSPADDGIQESASKPAPGGTSQGGSSIGGDSESHQQEHGGGSGAKAQSYDPAQAAKIQSLERELEGLNAEMSNTFLSDLGTRQASARHASGLMSRASSLAGEMNTTAGTNSNLVGMARCVFQASEVLDQAWTQNLAYDDATVHSQELSALYYSAVNAENGYLQEYNRYASALSS